MAAVPQKYYDTCTRVRRHFALASPSAATAAPSGSRVWPVYTLPSREPNLNLVLEHFPPPAEKDSASIAADVSASSRRSDVTTDSLEDRYRCLLRRIENEPVSRDTALVTWG
ncbi:hypothetical protein NESM_000550400 [Novymonas esmeraldas]|uniref:Uncharacterized protein n=1 Tax=Novymonas esmeraldas TaxID=1808958 RepID=A0AAW0ESX2_9TRYP